MPLVVAAYYQLLSLALDIDSRNSDDVTPLMTAASSVILNAFNLLLKIGADPTLKDNYGWTVLHRAAQGDNDEIIEKMLSLGLDNNSNSNNIETQLVVATSEGKVKAVKYLLRKRIR